MRPIAILVPLLALLGGCATQGKPQKLLQNTLSAYASTVRWGGFGPEALAYVDPEYQKAHPLSTLDMQRYQQVRVSYYHDQPAQNLSPTEVSQIVEIGVVNEHTQGERAVVDRQHWHWDEKAQRWWLTSGLPDITHHE